MFRSFVLIAITATLAVADEPVSFVRDVQPILASKCWNCHGPDANSRQADLRLDLRDAAEHVLNDELLERITSTDADSRMPPPEAKKPLSADEIATVKRWIQQGAKYESHWAFVPPVKPTLPHVRDASLVRNPIDRFILARLESADVPPSVEATKETLIRRLSLDVTGLPPTVEEVDEFLADTSNDSYEKLIDRLLASARYGEHMAIPWLDASRYADTDGYQNDRYRYMHHWRDWVILSLNANKPYDEFLIEQIAGDMLPNATLKQQIATGFCRNHRINSEDGSIPAEWHVENVVDRVDTLGTAILGMTISCARCHDHKYDPISQKDYYRLFAYFNNVPEWGVGPNNGNSPPFVKVPGSWPNLSPEEDIAQVPEPVKLRRARKTMGNGLQRPQAGSNKTVMVMHELSTPRETYLLQRGQYDQPDKSEVLDANVPDSLNDSDQRPKNRLELAKWLVSPNNPLTARVAVNRMWQHFFGTGLVRTSENFGTQGEYPSHPELLDWLATGFVESGWNVKAMQKLILMSHTYRQSSQTTPMHMERDPENRLIARGARYRMHPFVLRDAMLASSGLLVEKFGGLPTKPYMPPKIWQAISNNKYQQDKGDGLYRRSVYTFWRRTIPPPTMVGFNSAAREVCVVRKGRTNTPLQALTLMNNITYVESSRFLAERMLAESTEPARAIEFGFRQLTSREPTNDERKLLVAAHADFRKQFRGRRDEALKLLRTGEKPRDKKLDPIQHAAMTMTASLMMNLDESITKE